MCNIINWISSLVLAGFWYIGDVNVEVAEDRENGADTPRLDSYTIYGQLGDFCTCPKGTWTHTHTKWGELLVLLRHSILERIKGSC